MSEPVRTGLPLRDIAMLTLAMGLVSAVSYGLGYVSGRDRVAYVHREDDARGIDDDLADDALVKLISRIEVSDAADQGLSELRYPDELRGLAQDRASSGERYSIDLGSVPSSRLEDLQTVLRGRNLVPEIVTEGDQTRLYVGAFANRHEAASWVPLLEATLEPLGLGEPRVVMAPMTLSGSER